MIVMNRYAEILGIFSDKNFERITENFLNILIEKNNNNKNEVGLIIGMKYLKLNVK
jgi:hypothetical protein